MSRGSIQGQSKSVSRPKPIQPPGSPREAQGLKEIQARIAVIEVTQREILRVMRLNAGDSLVDLKTAGERLGKINEKTVRRMMDKGRLGWVATGAADQKPQRAVPESEIQRFIRENFIPAAANIAQRKIEEDFDAK